tara:strand:- start:72 stop:356 length:285 start_codon:yes stop_codon:yes gene_type:complete
LEKYFKSLETVDKIAWIIVGTLMFFILIGCEREPIVLNNCLTDPDPNAICTMDVNYQCGCNGYVYINPCHAYKDGVTRIRPISIDDPEDNCYIW